MTLENTQFQIKPSIIKELRTTNDGLIFFIELTPKNWEFYKFELKNFVKSSCFYICDVWKNELYLGECTISSHLYNNYKVNKNNNALEIPKQCTCSARQLLHGYCTCGYSSKEKIDNKYNKHFK